MKPLGDMLVHLAEALPAAAGDPAMELAIAVTGMELTLPVELRLHDGGELHASLPRGRLATGFDPPLGQVLVRFDVRTP